MLRLQRNGPHFKGLYESGCNRGPISRRLIFVDDKGKGRVNLVEIQDETWEKVIAKF